MPTFEIGARRVGDGQAAYFIADIAANHDGDLERAKTLIHLAAQSGANAAKFQHFRAPKIVSDRGFRDLGGQRSHQATWAKPVVEVYADASVPWEWTEDLKRECDSARIDFFSAAYDFEAVDMLAPYVDVYKIGSGDITWIEMLRYVAMKKKPVILSTGAADIGEVQRAVHTLVEIEPRLAVLQCNTNYTGSVENLRYVHLNVLRTYATLFPQAVLGLSDHTPGHATALGAVALGGRIVEKHFTDDTERVGPDHGFSMDPSGWREMVERTRELEAALGSTEKAVADNERETVILQRRCLRAARDIPARTVLTRDMIDVLRPAPMDAIYPYEIDRVLGLRTTQSVERGQEIRWTALGSPE
jgi:N-acetylneuraminate synthase